MGNYAILIVAGFVLGGTVLSIGMRNDTRDAGRETARVMFKEEAREAALTGMNLTLRRIIADEGDWSTATKYDLAETPYKRSRFVTVIKVVNGDTIDIRSTGTKDYIDRSGVVVDTTHTVYVRMIRRQPTEGGIAEAFLKAIVADGDLSIGGDFTVASIDSCCNADIHSNGILDDKGGNFTVQGYGTYTEGSEITNLDSFTPVNTEEGGEDPVIYQDRIEIPPINVDRLREQAEENGYYSKDNVDLSLSSIRHASFGDWARFLHSDDPDFDPEIGMVPDKPFIFFSEKSIDFKGKKTLNGWGAFVSNEGIHIAGRTELHGEVNQDVDGNWVAQMGLFAVGDLTLNGKSSVWATLYSGGHSIFNGNAEVKGAAILNTVEFVGSFTLTWAGFNEGFGQFFGRPDFFGPRVAAWAEW